MSTGIYKRKKNKKQLLNNMSLAKLGNANGFKKGQIPTNYKGENAKYATKHQWVYYHFGKANRCENKECNYKNPKRYHWANISGKYLRDRGDWIMLCPSCHKKMDRKDKIFCRNGHLQKDNIWIDNRGSRICKECKRLNAHKNYLKNKKQIIKRVTERRRFIRSTIKR